MPELPEVETIVRYLHPAIRGKRILDVKVKSRRVLRNHKNPQEFIRLVAGKRIKNISRFGKNIIFKLAGGTCFAIHLMMTGRLFLDPAEKTLHDRLVFRLSGGKELVFNDIRQFGWCKVIPASRKLAGPDALSLTFKEFKSLLRGRRGIIKSILLNQGVISGIGNIYSDEILWYAGIKPSRRVDSLSEREIRLLYAAMKKVLVLAIQKSGTSLRDYRKPDGSEGGYYKIRKAYRRAGERCLRDGAIIKRVVIGQRSAHYCPRHQV
jgi:formamidopyrimidine-DNA glycosylase